MPSIPQPSPPDQPDARAEVILGIDTHKDVHAAVVISLLFSLYASFQRREILIITLDALAGAPPSGVVLLENSLRYDMIDHLETDVRAKPL